ncbi:MAG: NYN domain-containing protein [Candidatus Limnocylindria bacterium]
MGVFVDVANLYYAAKGAGVDVDYVTLLKGAVKGRDLIRAYAYSGLDPDNDNQRKFIDFLSKNGYKVIHKDIRKYGDGKIKANLDIELVVDLFWLADRMDAAVIVSGDGDFAPAIRALQDKGVRAEVISFRGNTSSDLIAVADEFIDIMKIVEVGRTKKDAVVPPAMPAKEVTPEFGFREAPPSVAAAARAALRTGRTRGRTATRGEPPAVTAPAVGSEAEARAAQGEIPFDEEELVPTAGEPPEGRTRRRRRRGGRGRGAAGDGSAAAAVPSASAGEPGWEEFDSISEIDDFAEVSTYSFREADEQTLSELGVEPAGRPDDGTGMAATSPVVDDGADGARKKTRRGRRGGRGRKRPDQGAAGSDLASEDGTTPQPEAIAESPSQDVDAPAPAEPAPERRRRTSAAAGRRTRTAASSGADAAPAPPGGADSAPRRRSRSARAPEAVEGEGSTPAEPRAPRARRPRQPAADASAAGGGVTPASRRVPRARASKAARVATPAAGADAGSPGDARDDQPRGIWQRLISGRKP